MAKEDNTFLLVGAYASVDDAQADYEVIKELHFNRVIGGFDAAVITKDHEGKVHVNKDETGTRKGAWGGAGVGALVGLIFPPALIGSAVVGATVGRPRRPHGKEPVALGHEGPGRPPERPARRGSWCSATGASRSASTSS